MEDNFDDSVCLLLSPRGYALIDSEDYEALKGYHWNLHSAGYAKGGKAGGVKVYMHRLITAASPTQCTDHINGDRLDNRKRNLRVCSRTENNRNVRKISATRPYKGVAYLPNREGLKRWTSSICVNHKRVHLGYYRTAEEAATSYNMAALRYHREYANLNFIPNKG